MVLLVILFLNKKWIKADIQEMTNFANGIVQNPAQFKEEVVKAIEKF